MSLEARAGYNQLTELQQSLIHPEATPNELIWREVDILPAIRVLLHSASMVYLRTGTRDFGSGGREQLQAITDIASATGSAGLVIQAIGEFMPPANFPDDQLANRAAELIYVLDPKLDHLGELLKISRDSRDNKSQVIENLMITAAGKLINLKDNQGYFLSKEERRHLLKTSINHLDGVTMLPGYFFRFLGKSLDTDLAETLTEDDWQAVFDMTVKWGITAKEIAFNIFTRIPENIFQKAVESGKDQELQKFLQEDLSSQRITPVLLWSVEKFLEKLPYTDKYNGLLLDMLIMLQRNVAYSTTVDRTETKVKQQDLKGIYQLAQQRWQKMTTRSSHKLITEQHLDWTGAIYDSFNEIYKDKRGDEYRKTTETANSFFAFLWQRASQKTKMKLLKKMKKSPYAFFRAASVYDSAFLRQKDNEGRPVWISLITSMNNEYASQAAAVVAGWYDNQGLIAVLSQTGNMNLIDLFPEIKDSDTYLEYRKDAWRKRYENVKLELEKQLEPLLKGEGHAVTDLFKLISSLSDDYPYAAQFDLIRGLKKEVFISVLQSSTTSFQVKRELDTNWITDGYNFEKEELRPILEKLNFDQILPHIEKHYIRSCLKGNNADSVSSLVKDYDKQLLKDERQFFDLVMTEVPIEILEASDSSGQRIEDLIGERIINWLSVQYQELIDIANSSKTTLDSEFRHETELRGFIKDIATINRRWRSWLINHLKERSEGSFNITNLNHLIAL